MKTWLAIGGLAAVGMGAGSAHAVPGDMSVATFVAKADALRAKGFMALMSSDYKTLQGEAKAGGAAYRERLKAEKAAGHPSSCPPVPTRLKSSALLTHLKSYPAGQSARISMKTAMADIFIKTWPCPK